MSSRSITQSKRNIGRERLTQSSRSITPTMSSRSITQSIIQRINQSHQNDPVGRLLAPIGDGGSRRGQRKCSKI